MSLSTARKGMGERPTSHHASILSKSCVNLPPIFSTSSPARGTFERHVWRQPCRRPRSSPSTSPYPSPPIPCASGAALSHSLEERRNICLGEVRAPLIVDALAGNQRLVEVPDDVHPAVGRVMSSIAPPTARASSLRWGCRGGFSELVCVLLLQQVCRVDAASTLSAGRARCLIRVANYYLSLRLFIKSARSESDPSALGVSLMSPNQCSGVLSCTYAVAGARQPSWPARPARMLASPCVLNRRFLQTGSEHDRHVRLTVNRTRRSATSRSHFIDEQCLRVFCGAKLSNV